MNAKFSKSDKRDPRFDSLCGDYDEKVTQPFTFYVASYVTVNLFFQLFKQNYKFVDGVKANERKKLEQELEEEKDPERIKQIKYLIQRYVSVLFCGLFSFLSTLQKK